MSSLLICVQNLLSSYQFVSEIFLCLFEPYVLLFAWFLVVRRSLPFEIFSLFAFHTLPFSILFLLLLCIATAFILFLFASAVSCDCF